MGKVRNLKYQGGIVEQPKYNGIPLTKWIHDGVVVWENGAFKGYLGTYYSYGDAYIELYDPVNKSRETIRTSYSRYLLASGFGVVGKNMSSGAGSVADYSAVVEEVNMDSVPVGSRPAYFISDNKFAFAFLENGIMTYYLGEYDKASQSVSTSTIESFEYNPYEYIGSGDSREVIATQWHVLGHNLEHTQFLKSNASAHVPKLGHKTRQYNYNSLTGQYNAVDTSIINPDGSPININGVSSFTYTYGSYQRQYGDEIRVGRGGIGWAYTDIRLCGDFLIVPGALYHYDGYTYTSTLVYFYSRNAGRSWNAITRGDEYAAAFVLYEGSYYEYTISNTIPLTIYRCDASLNRIETIIPSDLEIPSSGAYSNVHIHMDAQYTGTRESNTIYVPAYQLAYWHMMWHGMVDSSGLLSYESDAIFTDNIFIDNLLFQPSENNIAFL